MSAPPLVSIVTPSYNQGRFLRRTIDSVLGQSYAHIEYVVIDGSSTDESVAVLASYGDRVTWVSEPDRGQAHAINKGLARCRGEICAYLNSDDVLLPGAVERVVADWDLVYGRAQTIDPDDHVTGAYRTLPFSLRRLAEHSCICQPAAFWRASLAERLGHFDEALHYCMDFDYWLRAALAGAKLVYVEDMLARARIHPDAKSTAQLAPMYLESLRVCQRHLGYVPRGPFVGLWRHHCERGLLGGWGKIPGVARLLGLGHHWYWWCKERIPALCPPNRATHASSQTSAGMRG